MHFHRHHHSYKTTFLPSTETIGSRSTTQTTTLLKLNTGTRNIQYSQNEIHKASTSTTSSSLSPFVGIRIVFVIVNHNIYYMLLLVKMRKQSKEKQNGMMHLIDLLHTRKSMVTAMFLKAIMMEESHILEIG